MKVRILGQLFIISGAPIVLLLVVAGLIVVQLATIGGAQQRAAQMADLKHVSNDIILREYLNRFGARGATLTLGPNHFKMMKVTAAAEAADLVQLETLGASVPGVLDLVNIMRPLAIRISERDAQIGATAVRDRDSVVEGYFGKSHAPGATAIKRILAANSADAKILDAASEQLVGLATDAQAQAQSAMHNALAVLSE